MSNENPTPESEIIDFDFDMSDPSLQLERVPLKGGVMELECVSTTNTQTSNGARMMKIQVKTVNEEDGINGKKMPPGVYIFDQAMLEDVGKMAPGSWRDRVGKIHLAMTGEKNGRPNTAKWQGARFKAKVVFVEERFDETKQKTFPAKNEISFYYPKEVSADA